MDCSLPGSSAHGVSHGPEYWSGLPFPSPGHLPNPGVEPAFPALAGRFFTAEPDLYKNRNTRPKKNKPVCYWMTLNWFKWILNHNSRLMFVRQIIKKEMVRFHHPADVWVKGKHFICLTCSLCVPSHRGQLPLYAAWKLHRNRFTGPAAMITSGLCQLDAHSDKTVRYKCIKEKGAPREKGRRISVCLKEAWRGRQHILYWTPKELSNLWFLPNN